MSSLNVLDHVSLRASFDTAFVQYADALFRFAYFRTRDSEVAADIVQETFFRAWRYVVDGNTIEDLRGLLFRTARNIIFDTTKQRTVRATGSLDALTEAGGDIADETSDGPYDPMDLERALAVLADLDPPEYREAVHLRYIEGFSPKEIAAILGASENVISVRITRGIKKLRTLFTSPTP